MMGAWNPVKDVKLKAFETNLFIFCFHKQSLENSAYIYNEHASVVARSLQKVDRYGTVRGLDILSSSIFLTLRM